MKDFLTFRDLFIWILILCLFASTFSTCVEQEYIRNIVDQLR